MPKCCETEAIHFRPYSKLMNDIFGSSASSVACSSVETQKNAVPNVKSMCQEKWKKWKLVQNYFRCNWKRTAKLYRTRNFSMSVNPDVKRRVSMWFFRLVFVSRWWFRCWNPMLDEQEKKKTLDKIRNEKQFRIECQKLHWRYLITNRVNVCIKYFFFFVFFFAASIFIALLSKTAVVACLRSSLKTAILSENMFFFQISMRWMKINTKKGSQSFHFFEPKMFSICLCLSLTLPKVRNYTMQSKMIGRSCVLIFSYIFFVLFFFVGPFHDLTTFDFLPMTI